MPYKSPEKKKRYEILYRSKIVNKDRRKLQRDARIAKMIAYVGGCCAQCGSLSGLEFHHVDPSTKSFNPRAMALIKWESLVPELDKCKMLCDACHTATHATSHGTVTMYVSHKCRCEKCKASIRAYRGNKERSPAKHGTVSKYKNGCRCESCRQARSIYFKRWYREKQGLHVGN